MREFESIERQTTPYTQRLITALLIVAVLVAMVYYMPSLKMLRVPAAYMMPVPLLYGTVVTIILYRLGAGSLPKIPLATGIALLLCSAGLDMVETAINTPTLNREANVLARALLESGHSVQFVYTYGLIAQILLQLFLCGLWVAFLRHRHTILTTAKNAEPKSYWEFIKAALGAGHLSWRQWFFPNKSSLQAKPYYAFWYIVVSVIGVEVLYRLYLGLEWLFLGYHTQNVVLIVAMFMLPMAAYLIWLWVEYSNALKANTLTAPL